MGNHDCQHCRHEQEPRPAVDEPAVRGDVDRAHLVSVQFGRHAQELELVQCQRVHGWHGAHPALPQILVRAYRYRHVLIPLPGGTTVDGTPLLQLLRPSRRLLKKSPNTAP
ncbi:hypothetical protein B5M09_004299 [Aphanomyces astaci]|uniref:Uncharacterized protein n=1 Tax=Aphanomyces astaci TaxID=112090 RepID=A0A3R7Y2Y6_APHAT|nr:hypothetical protein B5M09_004299 [Aphanomyces astaci]